MATPTQKRFNRTVEEINPLLDKLDEDYTKEQIDEKFSAIAGGIHYKGEVNYYSDLPNDAEIGDAYTVKYAGSSGTTPDGSEYVWGAVSGVNQWIDFSKDTYTKAEVTALLALKQDTIDSSHKLSSDLVDDTNNTHKFATAAQLEQIETNKTNILLIEQANGAKNILPVTLNTGMINNVTFTVNADKSISTSGTASALITNAYINLIFTLPTSGDWVLMGCAAGGSWAAEGSYRIDMLDGNQTGPFVCADTGSGVVFSPSQFQTTTACVRLRIGSGANMNGKTFKPMIIPKDMYDAGFTAYQPYAMSNAEITAWILAQS